MTKPDPLIVEYDNAGIPYSLDENGHPIPDWGAFRKIRRAQQDASFEKGPWKPEVRNGDDPDFPWEVWTVTDDGREERFACRPKRAAAMREARDVAFHSNRNETP